MNAGLVHFCGMNSLCFDSYKSILIPAWMCTVFDNAFNYYLNPQVKWFYQTCMALTLGRTIRQSLYRKTLGRVEIVLAMLLYNELLYMVLYHRCVCLTMLLSSMTLVLKIYLSSFWLPDCCFPGASGNELYKHHIRTIKTCISNCSHWIEVHKFTVTRLAYIIYRYYCYSGFW